MTPVKNALVSAMRSVRVTIPCDGPSCSERFRRKIHIKTGRTAKLRNNAYPMHVRSTQRAVIPSPAFTNATQRAKRTHPTTSFPTPAESTMRPTEVESNFNSVRIRQRTGKACKVLAYSEREQRHLTYRYGHRYADKQHVRSKCNWLSTVFSSELVVQPN